MPDIQDRIIVALDVADLEDAKRMMEHLKGTISFYKIGFEFFVAHGWNAVDLVRRYGGRVFLDLKLHDIPNTVKKTLNVVCEHAIDMVNVHALGGYDMMRGAYETVAEYSQKYGKKPLLIAVTVLTSHSDEQLKQELGIQKQLPEEVLALARLAHKAGLDGVVCSPQEVPMLRKDFPDTFCLVTPGVRPQGSAVGDQKRTCTPREALMAGSDYIVIGRPITGAADPRAAVLAILDEIKR